MAKTRSIPQFALEALSAESPDELKELLKKYEQFHPELNPTQYSAKINHVAMLRFLAETGRLNHELSFGNTHLLWVIANSSLDSASFLIEQAPEAINMADQYETKYQHRHSPLSLSVGKGWMHVDSDGLCLIPHSEVIKKLVEKVADINYQNEDGYSALHLACLHRDLEAILLLIQNGASLDIQTTKGFTPLELLFLAPNETKDILDEQVKIFTLDPTFFIPANFQRFANSLKTFLPDLDLDRLMDCHRAHCVASFGGLTISARRK